MSELSEEREAIIKLTSSVDNLTETLKEFKQEFKDFRANEVREMQKRTRVLEDWKTGVDGAISFWRTMWYFLGSIVVAYIIYALGWKK
jgi:uncharacterized membrane protein (DUF106 family)